MMENIRVLAKIKAIEESGLVWNLGINEAAVKFDAQNSKWKKKQVNKYVKILKYKKGE